MEITMSKSNKTFEGILVDHGEAPYENKKDNEMNYFITYKDKNVEKTLWGKDLERALDGNSGIKIGDTIKIKHLGKQTVTVSVPIKNDEGEIVRYNEINTHRNGWEVNKETQRTRTSNQNDANNGEMSMEADSKHHSAVLQEDAAQREQLKIDGINVMTIEQEIAVRNATAEGIPFDEAKSMVLDGKGDNGIEPGSDIALERVRAINPKLYEIYQVRETRRGKAYYWKDSDQVAFKEKGENKLVTESNSKKVAESIVEVADSKGWETIKVTGKEAFKQQVWMEASVRDMNVIGYKPTEQDLYELEKRKSQQNTAERSTENTVENGTERQVSGQSAYMATASGTNRPEDEKAKESQKPTEQERKNYQLLKEVKEDEHTSITKRTMDGEKSVTIAVKDGEKVKRMTFKVDDKQQSATAAVHHESKGDQVNREVVTNKTVDKPITKKIEAGLAGIHTSQKQRHQDTTIIEELNNDKAPYRDKEAVKVRKEELSQAYNTLGEKEAIRRYPELEDLYKLEGAATELANRRIGNQESRENYVNAIRDRSLNELAQGNSLPKIPKQAQEKAKQKEMALER
jgi:hypothetical protein